MQTAAAKFYVGIVTRRGATIGYEVNDCVGGMESQHERFLITQDTDEREALRLAQEAAATMNARAR
jgi:hypothetical protein